ncbi:hypothetical protein [Jannaschia rubra]|uniref:hypothetical protein n=1 Tax=Jannaschia rubra TaxID=282197 RepID=UPI002491E224|nr:hypothetical protein [Jannaschia rubra]
MSLRSTARSKASRTRRSNGWKRSRFNVPSTGRLRADRLRTLAADVIFLSLAGDDHNVLGLIEHPAPFTLGDLPDDGLDRVRIPDCVMRSQLEHRTRPVVERTRPVHRVVADRRIVHICPPPPDPDAAHMEADPKLFGDIVHRGVAPDPLRLRLYRLQCAIARRLAGKSGATFLPPPGQGCNDAGFLARDCRNDDPTHANARYGRLVTDQLADLEWRMQ